MSALSLSPIQTVLLAFSIALAASYHFFSKRQARFKRLPPGPKPSFLLGNKVPQPYSWRYFYEQSKVYGPLITIWNGVSPTVICSNVASASELMEKQARDTADRPRSIVGDEIFSNGKRILLVGYNDRWRRLRKALHNQLQPESARQFRPVQERAARVAITDILDDPANFQSHIKTYAATIVVNLGYGRSDKAKYSDPDIQKVIEGADRLGQLLRPGSWKIESFPWLRYVPGYLAIPKKWGADELALYRGALANAREKMATNDVAPSFATYITQKQAEFGLSDDEVAYLCGSIFGAGSDTSSSAITICVMAAATHPEIQKRVQEELDEVVGDSRSPSFDDLDDLPLLKAFVNESYRWRPVSSGGFLHKTTTDLAYDNYVIPAGTTIAGNHWAIHRDPDYYGPDVERFNIDRWLVEGGSKLNANMRHFQFGFGRRVCPGQHIANQSVYINTATLLWAFNITKQKDANGRPVEIDTLNFTNTVNSHPEPFQAAFEPRMDSAALRSVVSEM